MREEIGPARKPGTAAINSFYAGSSSALSPRDRTQKSGQVTYSDVAKLHRAIGNAARR